MKKYFAAVIVMVILESCAAEPKSNLDFLPNWPNSWHCGLVLHTSYSSSEFIRLSDGATIKMFFTGGTNPPELPSGKGKLCVSVPSYDNNDAHNTYYFQSFTPLK